MSSSLSSSRRLALVGLAALLSAACPTSSDNEGSGGIDSLDGGSASQSSGADAGDMVSGGGGGGGGGGSADGSAGSADDGSASGAEDASTASDGGSSQGSGGDASGTTDGTTTSTTTSGSTTSGGSGGGEVSLDCGGKIYACGDGIDNDADGKVDLDDPECTGVCDDTEDSFATGIPGDNMDCRQDCFFDGNSGQSEGCLWDLRCDPEDPGGEIGCGYDAGKNCASEEMTSQECIDFCAPLTPPGCDCFGCCTVQTEGGPVDIFLNGVDACSLDNIEACQTCTSRVDDCGNDCEPEMCERCFGEEELPVGCTETSCEYGSSCDGHADCDGGQICYLGCCYPSPG